jgi:heptosyltransferase-3
MENVAVVCARGLGDALLSMIVSHNLSLSRVRVTTFSSVLCELNDWFPNHTILPYPQKEDFEKTFSSFDTVIAADHSIVTAKHDFGNRLIVFEESQFNKSLSMAANLQEHCASLLNLPYSEKGNGLVIPVGLSWRCFPKRVAIHPASANTKKNWPAEKYIKLGEKLEKQGFSPYFCLSPSERKTWAGRVPKEQLPLFPTVHELACFLFESGLMIGNDSGVGHLASALSIPTISLFSRKSYARLWRPGWGENVVVAPPDILPGARLKQKYWKHLLSVRRVLRAFKKLS